MFVKMSARNTNLRNHTVSHVMKAERNCQQCLIVSEPVNIREPKVCLVLTVRTQYAQVVLCDGDRLGH